MYILPKTEIPADCSPPSPRTTSSTAPSSEPTCPASRCSTGPHDPADIRLDARHPLQSAEGRRLPPDRTDPVRTATTGRPAKASIVRDDLVRPKALVGLRSCDLTGLLCLDRFFLGQEYVDDVYRDHRKKMFIVANTCVRPVPPVLLRLHRQRPGAPGRATTST